MSLPTSPCQAAVFQGSWLEVPQHVTPDGFEMFRVTFARLVQEDSVVAGQLSSRHSHCQQEGFLRREAWEIWLHLCRVRAFGGRDRGSFLEVISLGVPPRFVVTHASWRSRAFFNASAGFSALETFWDTTVALMNRSLLAQTT